MAVSPPHAKVAEPSEPPGNDTIAPPKDGDRLTDQDQGYDLNHDAVNRVLIILVLLLLIIFMILLFILLLSVLWEPRVNQPNMVAGVPSACLPRTSPCR
jgi:hypothetical protein